MTRRIVICGMYRSGSTLLYNIVRLALERQHGVRRVWSGYVDWYASTTPEDYHVVKSAQVEPWLFDSTILLSWRHLPDVEASMRRFAAFHPERRRDTSVERIPQYVRWCLDWAQHADRIVDYEQLVPERHHGIQETKEILKVIGCDPRESDVIYDAAMSLPVPDAGTSSLTLLHAHHRTTDAAD